MKDLRRYVYSRMPDKTLAFDLVLPKRWAVVAIEQKEYSPDRLCRLALFQPDDGAQAEIIIEVAGIDREANPSDWLTLLLEQAGEQISDVERLQSEVGETALITSRSGDGVTRVVSRSIAIKDGSRMFVVRGRARENAFTSALPDLESACRSFRPLFPSLTPFSERFSIFRRTQPFVVSFAYPTSWKLVESNLPDGRGLLVDLKNVPTRNTIGRITSLVVAKSVEPDVQGIADQYLADLRGAGIRVELAPPSPEQRRLTEIREGAVLLFSGAARSNDGTAEIIVVIVGIPAPSERAHGIVALVGPSRAFVPGLWAIHQRAMEIVVHSIVVGAPEV